MCIHVYFLQSDMCSFLFTFLHSQEKTVAASGGGDGFVMSLADLKSVKLRKTSSSSSGKTLGKISRRKSYHFGEAYVIQCLFFIIILYISQVYVHTVQSSL